MKLTPELVKSAYQLLLDREPESEAVIDHWITSTSSIAQLRNCLLRSEEYCKKNWSLRPSMTGFEPLIRSQVDSELDQNETERLFNEVKQTWTRLGEVDPYWAVLSSDEFHAADDPTIIHRFYASGGGDLERIERTLARNGISLAESSTVVEYGCGLGRATSHLATKFKSVVGVDISQSMLSAADLHMKNNGIMNVTFKLLTAVEDIDSLPVCDLFFSLIVLQHSPPPIISRIVRSAIRSLNPGGVALFQVPTYLQKYRFVANEYLSGETTEIFKPDHKQYEVHAIRQRDLFREIHAAGGVLVEIIEDEMLGRGYPGSMSNTLLVQKS